MAQYRSKFTGEEIDKRLTETLLHEKLSQAEYDAKLKAGTLDPQKWYLIYRDFGKTYLMRIYAYKTLIAQRGEKASIGFPYTFPIIFI